jgi:GNAT superfamily N-acetyltransferase
VGGRSKPDAARDETVRSIKAVTGANSGSEAFLAGIERVFWATAGTRVFSNEAERTAYRDRWLGRYIRHFPESVLVAERGGEVAGYLVGCPDSFAEAAAPVLSDLGYYTPEVLAAACAFPAHFHVNVGPGWQGQGVGRQLVAGFAMMCLEAGSPGLHVVTGNASRAAAFYLSCGFRPRLDFASGGRRLTLYAMSL